MSNPYLTNTVSKELLQIKPNALKALGQSAACVRVELETIVL